MTQAELLGIFERHGVSPTTQRLEIAGILLDKPQHLSADQLLDRLQQCGGKVSKATVYNTLKLFSDCGMVRELIIDSSRKFYDSTTTAHHHFYHEDSGELHDIEPGEIELARLPTLPSGTVGTGIDIVIKIKNR